MRNLGRTLLMAFLALAPACGGGGGSPDGGGGGGDGPEAADANPFQPDADPLAPDARANGDGATSCSGGLKECGGSCTDTDTDEANCGSCTHACSAGQVCAEGGCVDGVTGVVLSELHVQAPGYFELYNGG